MTYVPPHPSVVLDGTPRAGSPHDVVQLARFAADIVDDAHAYRVATVRSTMQLQGLRSRGLTEARYRLEERLVGGSLTLQRSAGRTQHELERYAAEVERIHAAADSSAARTAEALRVIRSAVDVIEAIAAAIRVPVVLDWEHPPSALLPDPVLASAPGATLLPEEREAAVATLRVQHADRWLQAAAEWYRAVTEIRSEQRVWKRLIDERHAAERRFISGLDQTEIGHLIAVAEGSGISRKRTIAVAISGELWGSGRGVPGLSTSHELLTRLFGHASGRHVWNRPQRPDEVAASWHRLDESDQQRLIAEVPWVIGNTPGLPYDVRDQANQRMLEFYAGLGPMLSPRGATVVAQLRELIAAGEQPPVQIVALDLGGEVPLVAVGYGELDTAHTLTWQVPGMQNDADQALGTWDQASRNLYARQGDLLRLDETGSGLGVVAFLAYDTPDLRDTGTSKGVLSAEFARAGSLRLAAELDGAHVAQRFRIDGLDAARIAVIGHSYGTTTAANALTRVAHPVDAFTLAGSAGIDTGVVGSLDQLQIAVDADGRQRIYTGHASADRLAPLGLRYSGRANPNPELAFRDAPNYPGALHYSSDGFTTSEGERFEPTDGHSVIGRTEASLAHNLKHLAGFDASEGRGYWDLDTQSLHNLAATSLGLPQLVLGGLHVAEEE